MKPVHHYREYMISRYGAPLFRIPVDTGRGCPHRDADGGGGCTFCPEHGARAVQTAKCETLEQQIDEAMQFSRRRYGAKRFMLYFQAFSATHDLDESTRELYLRLLERHTFDAVSVGTRPDCLGDDTLAFLSELRPRMDVWAFRLRMTRRCSASIAGMTGPVRVGLLNGCMRQVSGWPRM
jgi:radical SAM superfamily enzyme